MESTGSARRPRSRSTLAPPSAGTPRAATRAAGRALDLTVVVTGPGMSARVATATIEAMTEHRHHQPTTEALIAAATAGLGMTVATTVVASTAAMTVAVSTAAWTAGARATTGLTVAREVTTDPPPSTAATTGAWTEATTGPRRPAATTGCPTVDPLPGTSAHPATRRDLGRAVALRAQQSCTSAICQRTSPATPLTWSLAPTGGSWTSTLCSLGGRTANPAPSLSTRAWPRQGRAWPPCSRATRSGPARATSS
mmetsp:Transcript_61346/g.182742  ORF Transcript_61346/g.182742 Transcript_61346/m.182742 type:complete len:254 (+) Transcript_61346:271-1032(+)